MLFADDVIDLAAEVSIDFVDEAVLAQALGTAGDEAAQSSADAGDAHDLAG